MPSRDHLLDTVRLGRRAVVRAGALGLAVVGGQGLLGTPAARALTPAARRTPVVQHWLGPDWWTNRPGDWLSVDGRIENHAPRRDRRGRIAANLTTELTGGAAVLRVRTGTLQAGAGFSGLVLGVGEQGADPRTRAVLGSASGEGGGLFFTYEADGRVKVRDHRSETDQFDYPVLRAGRRLRRVRRSTREDVELVVRVVPSTRGRCRVVVRAIDLRAPRARPKERLLSEVSIVVRSTAVRGGVALVSSDDQGSRARHWFEDFRSAGRGARHRPERALGPVVGTLFTQVDGRLRLTAQLMPLDPASVRRVVLERGTGAGWAVVGRSRVGPGFVASFDVRDWDGSRATPYRVRVVGHPDRHYTGTIPAEPTSGDLVVGSISCAKATHRPVDAPTEGEPHRPGEERLGLYTPRNVWFPYRGVVRNLRAQRPDLVVAHGDQYYENAPSSFQREDADLLDVMGRYLLWVWAFAEITRDVPTVVLVDDHDVYQPNLWGAGGIGVLAGESVNAGGYRRTVSWVNAVQRMQCGHNPVPASTELVGDGITTYYTTFRYGGVDFALVEDRKFKAAPTDDRPEEKLPLLGDAQEQMLRDWAADGSDRAKIVLSQTSFVALNTDAAGAPVPDQDSDGWPKPARDRVVDLLAGHKVLMLAGDQHSGALIRHVHPRGGPHQFAAPAVAASFQRWFEPRGNQEDVSGPWTDAFGNRVRVHAVVQPVITRAEYAEAYPTTYGSYGQVKYQRMGYGVVRVDANALDATVEAWPPDVNPTRPGARPYPGWPITVSLEEPPDSFE